MALDLRPYGLAYPAFAEANIRVRSKEGGFLPLKANRIQRQIHALQLASPRQKFYELKFRQGGLSTWHLGEGLFYCLVIEGFGAGFFTHSGDHSTKAYRIVRSMWDRIPKSTKAALPALVTGDEDSGLSWSNGSYFSVATAGGRERSRGDTLHWAHLSEFAFWEDPEKQLTAMLPTMPPWGRVTIETTPNGFNRAKELWDQNYNAETGAVRPDADYECVFLPWWLQEEYTQPVPPSFKPAEAEARLMAAHDLTPQQIMFRRAKQREHKGKFLQEYPEDAVTCWLTTGDSAFAPEVITELRQYARPAVREELDGLLRVWYDPVPGRAYVIGADSASGVPDGDYCAAVVRNARSGEHVATLMCNPPYSASRNGRMDPPAFARHLDMAGRRYNNALIVPERNFQGEAVCYALEHTYRYPQLFRWDPEHPWEGYGRDVGLPTRAQTKEWMLDQFRGALEAREFSSYDTRVSQQMADFIVWTRSRHGYEKVGARDGAHDDLMMAGLLSEVGRVRAAYGTQQRPAVVSAFAGSGDSDDDDGFRL